MALKEALGGTRWEPGETALINNAAVSEGATQSPNATFLERMKKGHKKHV